MLQNIEAFESTLQQQAIGAVSHHAEACLGASTFGQGAFSCSSSSWLAASAHKYLLHISLGRPSPAALATRGGPSQGKGLKLCALVHACCWGAGKGDRSLATPEKAANTACQLEELISQLDGLLPYLNVAISAVGLLDAGRGASAATHIALL